MSHYQKAISLQTTGKSFHDITAKIESIVAQSGVDVGLCTIFIQHTSASLVIQENADPDVLRDLSNFFSQLVPEDSMRYIHGSEGVDDMPGHIRSVLTRTSEQIPINNGRLVLGTWQAIYLWEHRQRSHQRKVVIHISS